MRTKMCGIDSRENAIAALEAGADALGFLVGITHLAEDKITTEAAKAIIESLPPFVSTVAVTHLRDTGKIVDMCRYLGVSTLQIHDFLTPEEVAECRRALGGVKIIKAVHVIDSEPEKTMAFAQSYVGVCDALLLDSRTADRLGGTGRTHDWDISREIVRSVSIPVILAGGLTAENVYAAVQKVRPYGVDVNSGVETGTRKDPQKMKAFIENAKRAEAE